MLFKGKQLVTVSCLKPSLALFHMKVLAVKTGDTDLTKKHQQKKHSAVPGQQPDRMVLLAHNLK